MGWLFERAVAAHPGVSGLGQQMGLAAIDVLGRPRNERCAVGGGLRFLISWRHRGGASPVWPYGPQLGDYTGGGVGVKGVEEKKDEG